MGHNTSLFLRKGRRTVVNYSRMYKNRKRSLNREFFKQIAKSIFVSVFEIQTWDACTPKINSLRNRIVTIL